MDAIYRLCQIIAEKQRGEPGASIRSLVKHVDAAIVASPKLKAALDSDERLMQINRDGATGYQIIVKGGIANIGTHYHLSDPEEFEAVFDEVLQNVLKPDKESIDFRPYIQSILNDEDLQEWNDLYTPTTVEDRIHKLEPTKSSPFKYSSRLRLRVEAVAPYTENQLEESKQEDQTDDSKPQSNQKVECLGVLEGLRRYADDHVLLIGRPGSGKTTSLETLLWQEANSINKREGGRIPVLVRLRRCTSTIEKLIQDFFISHKLSLDLTEVEHLLQKERLLILLDGLNELPESLSTEITNFRERYRRTTPMIVTTRDLSIGGNLGVTKALKMLPLSEQQVEAFVANYLGDEGSRLLQQLRGDRLRKFAETPLLLFMLCRVFAQSGRVPANLGLAFREFAQLYDKELLSDITVNSKGKWHKLLRHLSFAMMHGKTQSELQLSMPVEEVEALFTSLLQKENRVHPREDAELWLKDLMKYHLIQPVIGPNYAKHIEFRHQLLQEYYAAEYLLRILTNLSDDELTGDYLNYLKWTEPISLMLALIENDVQAMRLIRLSMKVDLILGARYTGEVRKTFQSTAVGLLESIRIPISLKFECLSVSQSESAVPILLQLFYEMSPDVNGSVVEVLSKIGGDAAILGLIEALKSSDKEVRCEALFGLEEIGDERAVPSLLEAMNDKDYDVRYSAICALTRVGNEAAVPALIEALYQKNNDNDIKRQVIKALGESGSRASVSTLLDLFFNEDLGFMARSQIIEALAKIKSKSAISGLYEALNDEDEYIRDEVYKCLWKIGGTAILPSLFDFLKKRNKRVRSQVAEAFNTMDSETVSLYAIEALKDSNDDIRLGAVSAIRTNCSESAIPVLLRALKDLNEEVRCAASAALSSIACEVAVPNLLDTLNDVKDKVRSQAAEALGEIGSEKAIPALLESLKDRSAEVRVLAAEALSKIGCDAATHEIHKVVRDTINNQKRGVRWLTVRALESIGGEIAVQLLFAGLKDQSVNVRWKAVEALDAINGKTVIPALLESLADEDRGVCQRGIEALSEISSEDVVSALLKAIKDRNPDVRHGAIKALSYYEDTASLSGLAELIDDQWTDISCEAVRAIGAINDEQVVPYLIKALQDERQEVRSEAVFQLGYIGNDLSLNALLVSLEDDYFYVRTRSAHALGRIGSEEAIPTLSDALKDSNFSVRMEAAIALGMIGSEGSVPTLIEVLTDSTVDVRISAIEALGRIGSEPAIKALLEILRDQRVHGSERAKAVNVLANVQGETIGQELLNIYRGPYSEVDIELLKAIGGTGGSALIDDLWQMNHKKPSHSYDIIQAISAIQKRCGFYNHLLLQDGTVSNSLGATIQIY